MLAKVTHWYPKATCTFTNYLEILQGNGGSKYFTRWDFSKISPDFKHLPDEILKQKLFEISTSHSIYIEIASK